MQQQAPNAQQIREELDRLWIVLGHMDRANQHRLAAAEFHEKAEETERQANLIRTELHATIKQMHEESTKYVNAIAVIGYAGYFAAWSFTKDLLPKEVTLFVGLMGMISIALFVIWEMWTVFAVRLKTISEVGKIMREMVSYEDFEVLKNDLQKNEAKRIAILAPAHRVVFAISSGTAFAGGLALMHALYMGL